MANVSGQYVWQAADGYEAYMGRWSRPLAEAFIAWCAAPRGARWLDVGCGTGALTEAILAAADPSEVVGIDPSPSFLDAARTLVTDPRARFELGDALDLPSPSNSYDAVVAGLVLNFVPDPAKAVSEMARVGRPGGAVGAYVWDFRGEMQLVRFFWEAAAALDAEAAALDPRSNFRSCEPEPLAGLFRGAGLGNVLVEPIDLPMMFRDLDDYWLPHTMEGAAMAQRYTSALDDERKTALRERLRVTLPVASDGTIRLIGRAWAVRGKKRSD